MLKDLHRRARSCPSPSRQVEDDHAVNFALEISFYFFCVEIALMSFAQPKYFMSFFFALDIAGTVSLVLDIPFLYSALGLKALGETVGIASGAKAARGARAARAAKMARLVRLIRLVRFVRLLKFFSAMVNPPPPSPPFLSSF